MIQPRTTTQSRDKSRKRLLREVYHSKVLPFIAGARPVRIEGTDQFYPDDVAQAAWKEKFRNLFHPGRSTEDLSDDEYAELLLQVEAFASTELGIEFVDSDRRAH